MSFNLLTKRFFELNSSCPFRAYLSFLLNDKVYQLHILKGDYTINYYKEEIIKEIIITTILWIKEKGSVNYQDYVTFSKVILKNFLTEKTNQLLDKKENGKSKKDFVIANIEDKLMEIFNCIEQYDCVNLVNGNVSGYLNLNTIVERLANSKLKFNTLYRLSKEYIYEFKIPLILKNDSLYDLVFFVNDEYKFNNPELDLDISLCIQGFNELFPGEIINNLILYDTINCKRKIFKCNGNTDKLIFEDLYKILVNLDISNSQRCVSSLNCDNCLNKNFCYLNLAKPNEVTVCYNQVNKTKTENLFDKLTQIKNNFKTRKQGDLK